MLQNGPHSSRRERLTQADNPHEIVVEVLKERLDHGDPITVLDVREQHEYQLCNIGGVLIPLAQLPTRLAELDPAREYAVICRTGRRSARAVEFLKQSGFTKVRNVVGGIHEWSRKIDPTIPQY